MKFRRRPRYGRFVDTPRKRKAAARRQQPERDSLPLFAELIAFFQPTIDHVMRDRADDAERQEQIDRDRDARLWRSVRIDIAALPRRQRRLIRALAAAYGGPLNAVAYAYFYR
ncbi:hypothetical protein [Arvimicrobium flavum]|uniref:hypothetical protein n=1 Tax=Arvimicrobium flavum TaxID=3393320 RepID=UPI00237AA755|nr:hypothetical protein [Mesorhizobium shangrilense]